MGDRANVILRNEGQPDLFFYTHWNGSELPSIVGDAIKNGRDRWGDESYLNRIIFCSLVAGQEGEHTGYGISSVGGEDRHVIVNHDTKTINLVGYKGEFSYQFGETILS